MMDKVTPFILALHSIDGLGPIRLKAVLGFFKDPKLAWEAEEKELKNIGMPQVVIERLKDKRKNLDPHAYAQSISRAGIKWLTIYDETYPKLLKEIYDPPSVLFFKGDILPQDEKAIGIVGSRKMSGYGKVVTEQFTQGLAQANFTIVSGLARGVDSQAHRTAIDYEGRTLAVLGGGLNSIFPPENTRLADKIAAGFGAVISEFPPDYPHLPGNFPARNRIISGLSLAVLVTEAAEDSGSLITARLALEQGREVFAVPGSITSPLSKGPIDLIREGARPVTSPQEILDELGIGDMVGKERKLESELILSEEERVILNCLENEHKHIDEVCRELNLPSSKVSATLLKLEILGIVRHLGAGVYCSK